MTAPLRTAQQLIIDMGLTGMTPSAFKRLAKQLGLPYHKIGRQPYYAQDAVDYLLQETRRWTEVPSAPASPVRMVPMPSPGQKMESIVSVQRARNAATELRRGAAATRAKT